MPETTPIADAHRKGEREDLQPIFEETQIDVILRFQPKPFEDREEARQPDRKDRKNEMKTYGKGELDAREEQGEFGIGHGPYLACGIPNCSPEICNTGRLGCAKCNHRSKPFKLPENDEFNDQQDTKNGTCDPERVAIVNVRHSADIDAGQPRKEANGRKIAATIEST